MSINKWNRKRIILCHVYKCIVNRAVTMRVIFTHCVAYNTCTFSVRFVRCKRKFIHCIKYASLYRFKTVPYIWQCSCNYYTYRIITVRIAHFFRKIKLYDRLFIIIHISTIPFLFYISSLAYFASSIINCLRGGTLLLISVDVTSSASTLSLIEICASILLSGSSVVSQSCLASISPRPL